MMPRRPWATKSGSNGCRATKREGTQQQSGSCVDEPSVEQLIRAGHLKKFPEVGKNGVCEACDNAGVLVECYSCNIVWHRGCIPTHQARPETSHLLESPDADWVCGTCLDEARAAHQKQMQQPLVHAIGPRQVVRSSSEMAEIGIVSVLTGAKNRYLCSE